MTIDTTNHEELSLQDIEQLLQNIEEKTVIPFIGNELCILRNRQFDDIDKPFIDRDNLSDEEKVLKQKYVPIEDYLAVKLSRRINTPYDNKPLFEIAADASKKHDIHQKIKIIYNDVKDNDTSPYKFEKDVFRKLVQIGFKTFFSISYTDLLEDALIREHGSDKVAVINYSLANSGPLPKNLIKKPIVLVNFMGAINGGLEFAVTEEQVLECFFRIISDSKDFRDRNRFVAEKAKKNSFLYFGYSYPAWCMRYIVRGLTNDRYTEHKLLRNVFVDHGLKMNSADRSFFVRYQSRFVDQINL